MMHGKVLIFNLRVVLLFVAQAAMLFAFFASETHNQIQHAFVTSLFVGALLALVFAWSTTLQTKYFVRKLIAFFAMFCLFSFCFSIIPALKLSDQAFYESGDWAPMAPEAISAPLAMIASVVGTLAIIPMWWLTSISEPPDPE